MEQPHFVRFGKKELAGEKLDFAEGLNEIEKCNCVLLSSVLQYIEDYKKVVSAVCERHPSYIIVERTPVASKSRIWIETVHEPIYEAVYPCYVFEETGLIRKFEMKGYQLIDSWHSLVDGAVPISDKEMAVFRSYVFRRM